MKLLPIFATASFALLLTACGEKETYTVDYLKQNDDVRAKVLAECAENKQTDQNCKNANEAKDIIAVQEFDKKQNH